MSIPDSMHWTASDTQALYEGRRELATYWHRELIDHIARYVQQFGPTQPSAYQPFAVALADLLLWIRADDRGEATWEAHNAVIHGAQVACGEIREHFPLKADAVARQHQQAVVLEVATLVRDVIVEMLTERCPDCNPEEIRKLAAFKVFHMSDDELVALAAGKGG